MTTRLARWGFVGLVVCAVGCGGSNGHSPTGGADLSTSGGPPADLAVTADLTVSAPGTHDLATPADHDLATTTPPSADMTTTTTPPPPADMATTTTPPPPPADMAKGAPTGPPTFSADVLPILKNNGCFGGCHMTSVWTAAVADANNTAALVTYLTTTKASQCTTLDLVTTNDAANSYLYEKISGTFPNAGCQSDAMPKGSGPLPTSQSDIVKAWINAGALNN